MRCVAERSQLGDHRATGSGRRRSDRSPARLCRTSAHRRSPGAEGNQAGRDSGLSCQPLLNSLNSDLSLPDGRRGRLLLSVTCPTIVPARATLLVCCSPFSCWTPVACMITIIPIFTTVTTVTSITTSSTSCDVSMVDGPGQSQTLICLCCVMSHSMAEGGQVCLCGLRKQESKRDRSVLAVLTPHTVEHTRQRNVHRSCDQRDARLRRAT